MKRFKLLAAVMTVFVSTAAVAGEELSPEALLPGHESKDSYTPGATFGKDVYLVAWQAGRLTEGDIRDGLKCTSDIVACRVDKSGKALDVKPFVVSAAKDLRERPSVAFGAGVFLVVWQDLRNVKDWDVYAARVTPEGKVLDPDGILVAGGARSQCLPRAAWDGKTFVVAWQDLRSNKYYEVCATRISGDGKVLDAQGIGVSGASDGHRYCPALASGGSGKSFVLWSANKYGFGAYPWSGGTLLTEGVAKQTYALDAQRWTATQLGPEKFCSPLSVAAGPNLYLASWTTAVAAGRGNASAKSNAAIFDAEGKRLVELMTLSGKPHHIISPDAVWDGAGFVAAWAEQVLASGKYVHDMLRATHLSAEGKPSGLVLDVSGTPESPARAAAVASDGAGTTLIAYEKHPEKADTPIKIGFRILTAK